MKRNKDQIMTPARTVTSWSLLALLWALPLSARAQQTPDAPTFGEVLDVRVINLEVVVTEGGKRVYGLSADDFRLVVDGQEVPIEYFTEVDEGRAVAAGALSSTLPATAPGEAVGTRYLIFIDDFFSLVPYRNQTLRKLAEQLPLLAPEDRMAIVAFDGRQVEMLSSWTRSLPELESALEAAQHRPALGLQRLSEQRQFDTVARFEGRTFGLAEARFFGRDFEDFDGFDLARGDELRWQVSRVVQGATSALRAFARPPGRKVMLLLSGGWPASTYEWVTGAFFPSVRYGAWGDRRLFDPLIDTANRLGYTLYPVDLNDSPNDRFSAEHGNLLDATIAGNLAEARDRSEEDALFLVADATGGRAALDGARLGALERVVEDTRSYYWLGFSPDWEQNDRRHRVQVEISRKGLDVRVRESFSDLSQQSELTMMVESAQLFDLPLPGQGELAVSFGEPSRAGFRKVTVPVRLEIPVDQITLLPRADGYGARLELRVAATDGRGGTADVPVLPLELRTESGPEAGGIAVYETRLRLRAQPHRLLLSVYDPASGNLLAKRVEISL